MLALQQPLPPLLLQLLSLSAPLLRTGALAWERAAALLVGRQDSLFLPLSVALQAPLLAAVSAATAQAALPLCPEPPARAVQGLLLVLATAQGMEEGEEEQEEVQLLLLPLPLLLLFQEQLHPLPLLQL